MTWVRGPRGLDLYFSRDEQRARAPEAPPRRHVTETGQYLSATDGEAGGHWVLVNDAGVAAALLNGYLNEEEDGSWRSRGLLMRDLGRVSSLDEAQHLVEQQLQVHTYKAFQLALFDGAGSAALLLQHRGALECEPLQSAGLLASSSWRAPEVRASRAAAFERWNLHQSPDPERLLAFHASTGPEGPDAWSPCMAREDAATRSLTHVAVRSTEVLLAHAAGPPHTTPLAAPLRLPRVG